MNYLHQSQVISFCNAGKSIEQFIQTAWEDEFRTFEWLTIEKNKEQYILTFHCVFDERDEGCKDIYNFSYVEPDELHGTELLFSNNIEEVLEFAKTKYDTKDDKYLPFGYLNDVIQSLKYE
jgi:hypothetical protein